MILHTFGNTIAKLLTRAVLSVIKLSAPKSKLNDISLKVAPVSADFQNNDCCSTLWDKKIPSTTSSLLSPSTRSIFTRSLLFSSFTLR